MHFNDGLSTMERACKKWYIDQKNIDLDKLDKTADQWGIYMLNFLSHYDEARRGKK